MTEPPQLGTDVFEAPAGMGTNVFEAPAGIGSYVTEGSSPFDRTGSVSTDVGDEDVEGAALDDGEAAIEGLGALNKQLTMQGKKLAYATSDGKASLASKGYGIHDVKKSVRLPGVDIVAVTSPGQTGGVVPGYIAGQAQGAHYGAIPAPVASMQPHGIFDPNYCVQ